MRRSICGPDLVRPSEYLRLIGGGDKIGGEKGWRDEAEMQEFFDLIMRHWNSVVDGLNSGEPFMPYLLEGDDGIARANDWAEGFARGMKLWTDGWTELFDDERHAGFLVPILALAHERDPDPTMRPYKGPIDAERREQLIIGAAAGVMGIIGSLVLDDVRQRVQWRSFPHLGAPTERSDANEPCPCGSGKKFKKCCGAVTLH